ncbi:MAG: GDSL-type esterase/lipase family protein [Phycisphaerae bacterium]
MRHTIILLPIAIALAGCSGPEPSKAPESADRDGFWQLELKNPPAENPATIPTARSDEPRWMRRHQRFVDQASRDDVDLLFIGDSITEQWFGPGLGIWRKRFVPLNAANFGMSADRTEHVLWRLENGILDRIDPKVVVLMIGTNNLKAGPVRMSPEQTALGVVAVVNLLLEKLPDARILVMEILPRQPEYDWIDGAIARTNALLATCPEELERVDVVQISQKFLDPAGRLDPKYYRTDKLHLSAEGYEIWADAIEPEIRKTLPGS